MSPTTTANLGDGGQNKNTTPHDPQTQAAHHPVHPLTTEVAQTAAAKEDKEGAVSAKEDKVGAVSAKEDKDKTVSAETRAETGAKARLTLQQTAAETRTRRGTCVHSTLKDFASLATDAKIVTTTQPTTTKATATHENLYLPNVSVNHDLMRQSQPLQQPQLQHNRPQMQQQRQQYQHNSGRNNSINPLELVTRPVRHQHRHRLPINQH